MLTHSACRNASDDINSIRICKIRAIPYNLDMDTAEKVIVISKALSKELSSSSFEFTGTVYNPLEYAWENYESFTAMAFPHQGNVLLVGMNPGPFGMMQTGVPFGNAEYASSYLGINGKVGKPLCENPKRPIEGMAVRRREVSGERLWQAASMIGSRDDFFSIASIWTFCPLAFISEEGRNITPVELPKRDRVLIEAVCSEYLMRIIDAVQPIRIAGIGGYASKMVRGIGLECSAIPHPSPRSPISSSFWPEKAAIEIRRLHDEA